ncbi:MAG: hypothetical protein AAGK33_04255 [Pseudomonadota bacterium]
MAVTTITKLGTWDDVFGQVADDVRALADHLRSLVVGLDSDTTEVPRKGDRAVSYGHGEKKMSESYCYIMPQKGYVNLGFWWGAVLDDPNSLLEGKGKKLRHVKVHDMAMARSAGLASLVYNAMAERRAGLEAAAAEKAAKAAAKKKKPAPKSRAKVGEKA